MKPKKRKTITELFIEGRPIDAAIRKAALEAHRRHKVLGQPIVVWRNGKTVVVAPKDIAGPKLRKRA